jgi:hypothetical protein
MEYTEFKRHLGKAGLDLREFASLLGVSPTAVSNHAGRNLVPRSYAVLAVLLGDAADRNSNFRAALARFGLHISPEGGNVRRLEDFKQSKKKPSP